MFRNQDGLRLRFHLFCGGIERGMDPKLVSESDDGRAVGPTPTCEVAWLSARSGFVDERTVARW
jgi:hypothetical protein